MLNIFGGPFRDTSFKHAFNSIQNTPSLVLDMDIQRRRYVQKLIDILQLSSEHEPLLVHWNVNSQTTIIHWGGNSTLHRYIETLYSEELIKSHPKSDWTNEPPKKRIPYFSRFHI